MSDENKNINELTATVTPAITDEYPIWQSGVSKKVTLSQVLTAGFDYTIGTATVTTFTSTGIDDNATSVAVTIDSSQNVGIGVTTPDGKLHVHTASAGAVTAHVNADDVTIESDVNVGISLLAPNASTSSVFFGSTSSNLGAFIDWTYNADAMNIKTNKAGASLVLGADAASEFMRINSTGKIGIGTGATAPDGLLHVHTATAGTVTANANADELIVENSGNAGISILAPDANISALYFGSPTDNLGAFVQWDHDNLLMKFGTHKTGGILRFISGNNATAGSFDASQNFILATGDLIITTPTTPASAGAAGTIGTIAWDTGFLYVCTATNSWERVAIASW